jgi:hypothetical protein
VLNGLSSGEGLIWAVRDPIEKKEPVKEKGVITGYQTVITDHGVSDKRLMIIESEFAAPLRMTKRDGNTLSTTLRLAWESGKLQLMTKNSPARATDAHVSIIGHITKEELVATMSEVEGFNGFANRFLWLCVKRSKLLPEGGAPVDLTPFVGLLTAAMEHAKTVGRMSRDEEASELWAELYRKMAEGRNGLFGAVTSRAEAQVLRLSLIYALLDRVSIIRAEHLRAAYALWHYAEDSARYVFGDSTGDKLADKVLEILRTGPKTRKEIHSRTNRHIKAEELTRVLTLLRDQGLVKSYKNNNTGGRPSELWSLA